MDRPHFLGIFFIAFILFRNKVCWQGIKTDLRADAYCANFLPLVVRLHEQAN